MVAVLVGDFGERYCNLVGFAHKSLGLADSRSNRVRHCFAATNLFATFQHRPTLDYFWCDWRAANNYCSPLRAFAKTW